MLLMNCLHFTHTLTVLGCLQIRAPYHSLAPKAGKQINVTSFWAFSATGETSIFFYHLDSDLTDLPLTPGLSLSPVKSSGFPLDGNSLAWEYVQRN